MLPHGSAHWLGDIQRLIDQLQPLLDPVHGGEVVVFHGLVVGIGIDHGGVELLVTQELLDGSDRATGVQVHGGVLDPSGVDIHWHPIVVVFLVEGRLGVMWAQVAQVISGRAHESVHCVGLAHGGLVAHRAGVILPGRVDSWRVDAAGAPFDVIGQQHGQLVFGHRIPTTGLAIYHGDGRAPILGFTFIC
jgi:hypothetical protein